MDEYKFSYKMRDATTDKIKKKSLKILPLVIPESLDIRAESLNWPKGTFRELLRAKEKEKGFSLKESEILQFKTKKTERIEKEDEIHILLVTFELGTITLLFKNYFEYLVFEGSDTKYSYLGNSLPVKILLNILGPQNTPIAGLGEIKEVIYLSNEIELRKQLTVIPIRDTILTRVTIFMIGLLFPIFLSLFIPLDIYENTSAHLALMLVYCISYSLYPILMGRKVQISYGLLCLVGGYLLFESLIHFNILAPGTNAIGLFNNMSRQGLISQIQSTAPILEGTSGFLLWITVSSLSFLIPALDLIIFSIAPFTIGYGIRGFFLRKEKKSSTIKFLPSKVIFVALFLIGVIVCTFGYHALAMGSEGTSHAALGLAKAGEALSDTYILNFATNYEVVQNILEDARFHLDNANLRFKHLNENLLFGVILSYAFPQIGGIPLQDLPEILELTGTLSEFTNYIPNILWAYHYLQTGFLSAVDVLSSTTNLTTGIVGLGAAEYEQSMMKVFDMLNLGRDNLSNVQDPLLALLGEVRTTLDYSVFEDLQKILTETEIGLPILIQALDMSIPWLNGTYKTLLAINDLYDLDFSSPWLSETEEDFSLLSAYRSNITQEIETLPVMEIIPVTEIVDFLFQLDDISKYFLYTLNNGTLMFQSLNKTISLIRDVYMGNTSNVIDPIWSEIQLNIDNTSNYIDLVANSTDSLSDYLESESDFTILPEFNSLLTDINSLVSSYSSNISIIDDYFYALNNTYLAYNHFALGSYHINQSVQSVIENISFVPDFTPSENNFTLVQELAELADSRLALISSHLINEQSINVWRDGLVGDTSTNETNSLWINALLSLELIRQLEINPLTPTVEFDLIEILERMDELNLDFFSIAI